ncbi:MAG TPA: signal peptidase I [Candidatus Saccharimonadales bacterium]
MNSLTNSSFKKHKTIRDIVSIAIFVASIWVGALLINTFVFQTYTVNGASMEDTLHTGDHVFVNKLPETAALISGKAHIPERGQIIIFKNPLPELRREEEFIVKRVVGLPGERVVVENGKITIFNTEHPTGFDPDTTYSGPRYPTEGNVDITVPEKELFVAGDNRLGRHSFDSRNGLSTIPLSLLQGHVTARFFPFNQLRGF